MKSAYVAIQLLLLELFNFNLAFAQLNSTHLQPPLERMLSRRKRFLLMPKGCHLKFTGQLSKRLIATTPRGFNFVMEMALYYPAPTTRQDVIPKRLRKPTTTTPKPKGTKPPIFVCVPGSLICWKAKPAMKPMKVQRIDENVEENVQWIETQKNQKNQNYQNFQNYKKYQNYTQQYAKPQPWSKWSNPQQYERYKWQPAHHKQTPLQYYRQSSRPAANLSKWASFSGHSWNRPSNHSAYFKHWTQPRFQQYRSQIRRQHWRRSLRRADTYLATIANELEDFDDPLSNMDFLHFPDLEPHVEWTHYQSHRDRRQLFHQFEGLSELLGFDMKSCLVRAICESKRYLLPPGYSLIQDVLRVVFTLPTTSGLEDDYSRAMRADYETCDKLLKPKCAFNILNWFLNPVKGL